MRIVEKIVYLDNAATTIVAPEVADVIDKAMREHWANPSSLYGPGARSEEALNTARAAVARTLGCKSRELYFTSCGSAQVAKAINCQPGEIFFTGCGSEADNWAIKGTALKLAKKGKKHLITSQFEHHAVLHSMKALEREGFEVTYLPITSDGFVRPEDVEAAIRPEAALRVWLRSASSSSNCSGGSHRANRPR